MFVMMTSVVCEIFAYWVIGARYSSSANLRRIGRVVLFSSTDGLRGCREISNCLCGVFHTHMKKTVFQARVSGMPPERRFPETVTLVAASDRSVGSLQELRSLRFAPPLQSKYFLFRGYPRGCRAITASHRWAFCSARITIRLQNRVSGMSPDRRLERRSVSEGCEQTGKCFEQHWQERSS